MHFFKPKRAEHATNAPLASCYGAGGKGLWKIALACFDYPTFRHQFRQRAVLLGIDPVAGATSYDIARIRADQRRAAHVDDHWWRDYALWTDSAPHRSDTEEQALYLVFREAFTWVGRLVAGQTRQRDRLQRKWRDQDATTSLRELLARRGDRLVWIDALDGSATSAVVPVLAEGKP